MLITEMTYYIQRVEFRSFKFAKLGLDSSTQACFYKGLLTSCISKQTCVSAQWAETCCLGLHLLQCNKMNNQYCILNCTPCCIIITSSCKLNKKFISFTLQYYIQDCDYIAKNSCQGLLGAVIARGVFEINHWKRHQTIYGCFMTMFKLFVYTLYTMMLKQQQQLLRDCTYISKDITK